MYSRLLVCLDGSPLAEQVLPYAIQVSRGLNVPIELLVVVNNQPPFVDSYFTTFSTATYLEEAMKAVREQARDYLRKTVKQLKAKKLTVTSSRLEGYPAEQILKEAAAKKDTMIAITTHGRSGLGRTLFGSVADKVLRESTSPVLLVRASDDASQPADRAIETLVVPLDGSPLAERILPHVTALANGLSLDVTLMMTLIATLEPAPGQKAGKEPEEAYIKQIRQAAADYLKGAAGRVRKAGVEKVDERIGFGPAAGLITQQADETKGSLIAMTTHGRSGVERWWFGSVA
ncbi:MAG: hypothetical protein FJ317_07355, partial [SAR202 cluster bacterium]|nr:hypothetical protein [SAR202 cluster bacterium]